MRSQYTHSFSSRTRPSLTALVLTSNVNCPPVLHTHHFTQWYVGEPSGLDEAGQVPQITSVQGDGKTSVYDPVAASSNFPSSGLGVHSHDEPDGRVIGYSPTPLGVFGLFLPRPGGSRSSWPQRSKYEILHDFDGRGQVIGGFSEHRELRIARPLPVARTRGSQEL